MRDGKACRRVKAVPSPSLDEGKGNGANARFLVFRIRARRRGPSPASEERKGPETGCSPRRPPPPPPRRPLPSSPNPRSGPGQPAVRSSRSEALCVPLLACAGGPRRPARLPLRRGPARHPEGQRRQRIQESRAGPRGAPTAAPEGSAATEGTGPRGAMRGKPRASHHRSLPGIPCAHGRWAGGMPPRGAARWVSRLPPAAPRPSGLRFPPEGGEAWRPGVGATKGSFPIPLWVRTPEGTPLLL